MAVAAGLIAIWSGTLANIPANWVLCDGNNSTPNLVAKFIKGAATGSEAGSTGGSDTHTHASMTAAGSHTHGLGARTHTHTVAAGGSHIHTSSSQSAQNNGAITTMSSTTGSHQHTTDVGTSSHTHTSADSGTHTHAISTDDGRPPYYEVAYIMSNGSGLVATGIIIIWTGLLADIPAGWALCNGTDSPDLRAKFVRGVNTNATDPGTTGGAATHNHTETAAAHTHGASNSQGAHIHSFSAYTWTHSHNVNRMVAGPLTSFVKQNDSGAGNHTHADSDSTGAHTHTLASAGSHAHDVNTASSLPAYYDVAFIINASADSIPGNGTLIWTGTIANIPSGYARVADLDSKFIRGAAAGDNPGGTGGSNTHTHTDENNADHTDHTVSSSGAHQHATTDSIGAHTHTTTATTNPTDGYPAQTTYKACSGSSGAHTHTYANEDAHTNHAVGSASAVHNHNDWSTDNGEPAYYTVLFLKYVPPLTITGVPIVVTSSIKNPGISGSGSVSIVSTPLVAVSSIVLGNINYAQMIILVPLTGAGSIKNPTVVPSGSAEIIAIPLIGTSSIKNPSISGSGAAFVVLDPLVGVSSIFIYDFGGFQISPLPIQSPSSIKAPSIIGTGDAPIILIPLVGISSIKDPTLLGSGSVYIVLVPLTEVSSIENPSISGSGSAPISPAAIVLISSMIDTVWAGGETLGLPGVYVSGAKVSIVKDSLSISKAFGERGTAQFAVSDAAGTSIYLKGMPVQIYNDLGRLIFAGFIEKPEPYRPGVRGEHLVHKITCVDNKYIADKRRVIRAYQNQTAGYIAQDLFDNYWTHEGVTVGTIEDGPTVIQAVFNYLKGNDSLDELAEKTSMYWDINDHKQYFFRSKTTSPSPWVLKGRDIEKGSFVVAKANPLYRNRQYIRGPLAETDLQQETHYGNGSTLSYTLGYPCAKEPVITVDGTAQSVGIKGLETDKDWYWSKGDSTIVAAVAPADGLEIIVDYYGQFPIIYRADDWDEITARQLIEGGGTGYVDDLTDASDVTSTAAAAELAAGKLAQYGGIGHMIEFSTRKDGLRPGQLLKVEYPERDLDLEVFITDMKAELHSGQWIYNYKASESTSVGGWAKFFSDIFKKLRLMVDVEVGSTEIIVMSSSHSEEWTRSESVTEVVTLHQAPGPALFPGPAVYP